MKQSSFFHHLHPVTIPARESRFRYTFGLGGISVFLFLVLVVTGALELFYYVPSPERANQSVQTLTYLVPFGWLVRSVTFDHRYEWVEYLLYEPKVGFRELVEMMVDADMERHSR